MGAGCFLRKSHIGRRAQRAGGRLQSDAEGRALLAAVAAHPQSLSAVLADTCSLLRVGRPAASRALSIANMSESEPASFASTASDVRSSMTLAPASVHPAAGRSGTKSSRGAWEDRWMSKRGSQRSYAQWREVWLRVPTIPRRSRAPTKRWPGSSSSRASASYYLPLQACPVAFGRGIRLQARFSRANPAELIGELRAESRLEQDAQLPAWMHACYLLHRLRPVGPRSIAVDYQERPQRSCRRHGLPLWVVGGCSHANALLRPRFHVCQRLFGGARYCPK